MPKELSHPIVSKHSNEFGLGVGSLVTGDIDGMDEGSLDVGGEEGIGVSGEFVGMPVVGGLVGIEVTGVKEGLRLGSVINESRSYCVNRLMGASTEGKR